MDNGAIVYDFYEALSDKFFYGHLIKGKDYTIKEKENEEIPRIDPKAANQC